LTNLLLMNKPVLYRSAREQAGVEMGWGFTVVGMTCRSEVESGEISQDVRTTAGQRETHRYFRHDRCWYVF